MTECPVAGPRLYATMFRRIIVRARVVGIAGGSIIDRLRRPPDDASGSLPDAGPETSSG